jgi:hypothetical protein
MFRVGDRVVLKPGVSNNDIHFGPGLSLVKNREAVHIVNEIMVELDSRSRTYIIAIKVYLEGEKPSSKWTYDAIQFMHAPVQGMFVVAKKDSTNRMDDLIKFETLSKAQEIAKNSGEGYIVWQAVGRVD